MKGKEKQIEEMAKEIFNTCAWRFGKPNDYKEIFNDIAEDLIKLNYRKLPEGARVFIPTDDKYVLLSREEYDTLKTENDKYVKDCIDYLATINKLENKVWEVEQQASKETAEKIYKDIRLFLDDKTLAIITRYFKEILGVEIKE